jgi:uncharacterized membrane protein YbhN (UPF0104 family)
MTTATEDIDKAGDAAKLDRLSSYVFSYLLGIVLLGALIYFSGAWNFIANTRLLSVMIDSGIVEYHDAQHGWIKGVPDLKYYLKSQDPIKWSLVDLAGFIFIIFWLLKTLQFQILLRFTGVKATFTQVGRAYLYGIGLNRFLPFNIGHEPIVETLKVHQGASEQQALLAIFLAETFVLIEIVVYAFYGIYAMGWSIWLSQIFWSLVILGACYLMIRPTKAYPRPSVVLGSLSDAMQALRALAQQPVTLTGVTLLSLVAFGLEDVGAYVIAMAFTSTHVVLNVSFNALLMAIVASYIARLIPITPGGIGQFEWGFAAGLYLGGLGFPECAVIAILDNFVRYVAGTFVYFWIYFLRVDYSFELFSLSRKPSTES